MRRTRCRSYDTRWLRISYLGTQTRRPAILSVQDNVLLKFSRHLLQVRGEPVLRPAHVVTGMQKSKSKCRCPNFQTNFDSR